MRRSLLWTLIVVVAMTAAALWLGDRPPIVSAIETQAREHAATLDIAMAPVARPPEAVMPLPSALVPMTLDAATRDVFVPLQPPAPKAPPAPPVQVQAPPPPPPQAPALNVRFLGSVVSPSGQRVVYLSRGDTGVPVAVGDRLDEGYVVENITSEAVTLVYPQLDARVTVPIPPASQQ